MTALLIDQWIVYALLFISIYFEVFLLTSFIERKMGGLKIRRQSAQPLPKVAIVVPCYNEEKTIAATVRSLLPLPYHPEKL